jgi:chlorobactene glucosyltransferase
MIHVMERRGLLAVSASLTVLVARDLWRTWRTPTLRRVKGSDHTSVSVLIPARDEAQRIGRLLDGLTRQEGHDFDVTVLDDGSEDGTADVVRTWSDRIATLRVIAGEPLPPGWSGKCWACWQAAQSTSARWLLFLDADTAPQPGLIASLVAHAEGRALDLLTVIPLVETETFWERVLLPPFGTMIGIVFPPSSVNDPASPIAMANGPCILIRRAVYEATGGHAAVRASILEDVELGQMVKRAGYRIELAAAPALLRVRLYTGFRDISQGLQKNAWAGFSAGGWRSAWSGLRQLLLALVPWVCIVSGLVARRRDIRRHLLAHALYGWCLTTAVWGWTMRRYHAISPLWGATFPLGIVMYFGLAGRAWVKLLRGTGVGWKGRTYGST